MRKLTFAALLVLQCLLAGGAQAAPCLAGTLEDYLMLGPDGCTIDSLRFADFALGPAPTDALPFSAIQVTPLTGPQSGLLFTPSPDAVDGGQFLDELIAYTVTALAAPLVAARVAIDGASASGTGAVTAVNDLCLGGTFTSSTPIGCATDTATLIASAIDGLTIPSDHATFLPVALLQAITDIGLDARPDGSARVTVVESTFATATVPTPGSVALVLAALGALLAAAARRRPRR